MRFQWIQLSQSHKFKNTFEFDFVTSVTLWTPNWCFRSASTACATPSWNTSNVRHHQLLYYKSSWLKNTLHRITLPWFTFLRLNNATQTSGYDPSSFSCGYPSCISHINSIPHYFPISDPSYQWFTRIINFTGTFIVRANSCQINTTLFDVVA